MASTEWKVVVTVLAMETVNGTKSSFVSGKKMDSMSRQGIQ